MMLSKRYIMDRVELSEYEIISLEKRVDKLEKQLKEKAKTNTKKAGAKPSAGTKAKE